MAILRMRANMPLIIIGNCRFGVSRTPNAVRMRVKVKSKMLAQNLCWRIAILAQNRFPRNIVSCSLNLHTVMCSKLNSNLLVIGNNTLVHV